MEKVIDIPEGVTVEKQGSVLVVKGKKGELSREMKSVNVDISVSGGQIKVKSKNERRRVMALTGTFASHINNMLSGVIHGYEARLKSVYSHFPMKIKVEAGRVVIQNFMGGRDSMEVEIAEGVEVKIAKDDVIVSGLDKEAVGQTAGRIEQKTRVSGFDRRVFQDGIHLVKKTSVAEGVES